MNAVRGPLPQRTTTTVALTLAQRAKANTGRKGCLSHSRQMIAERYPAGLISEDELEALLGIIET